MIQRLRDALVATRAEHRAQVSSTQGLRVRVADLEESIMVHDQARQLLLQALEIARERAARPMEAIVSGALPAIFQDPSLKFVVRSRTSLRSGVEIDYRVIWDHGGQVIEEDPIDAKGGSIVDVVATALQIYYLRAFVPRRRQVLWLDEPGKNLDAEKISRYSTWLSMIAKQLGIQIIVVTHEEALIDAANSIHRVIGREQGAMVQTHVP